MVLSNNEQEKDFKANHVLYMCEYHLWELNIIFEVEYLENQAFETITGTVKQIILEKNANIYDSLIGSDFLMFDKYTEWCSLQKVYQW